ncbi:uncharacterized protein TNCV_414411 [Trichonephila clavipes]|nr:uncharacterized protein TNCV_414411 [Trichonephila clavipes]
MFKEGRESEEHEPRAGRPSTSRTAENEQCARYLLITALRLSVRMITEQLLMNKIDVHKIITPTLPQQTFFVFFKVKTALKGRLHGTLYDVKRPYAHVLKDVSVGDFQGAYKAWKRRLQKCVHVQGAYVEDY